MLSEMSDLQPLLWYSGLACIKAVSKVCHVCAGAAIRGGVPIQVTGYNITDQWVESWPHRNLYTLHKLIPRPRPLIACRTDLCFYFWRVVTWRSTQTTANKPCKILPPDLYSNFILSKQTKVWVNSSGELRRRRWTFQEVCNWIRKLSFWATLVWGINIQVWQLVVLASPSPCLEVDINHHSEPYVWEHWIQFVSPL